MYHNLPVLDVHGHVSVPFGANAFLMLMMGSNTPMPSPIGQDKAGPAGVSVHDFHEAALAHARYMDERSIDCRKPAIWDRWSVRGRSTRRSLSSPRRSRTPTGRPRSEP